MQIAKPRQIDIDRYIDSTDREIDRLFWERGGERERAADVRLCK